MSEKELDRQAVLEATTMAIVTQGGPSFGPGTRCVYHSADGRKCAIGHLIADEFYDETLEGEPVIDGTIAEIVSRSLGVEIGMDDIWFLDELQRTHDNASQRRNNFFQVWCMLLKDLCKKYDLRFPEELV